MPNRKKLYKPHTITFQLYFLSSTNYYRIINILFQFNLKDDKEFQKHDKSLNKKKKIF
jgi:hypothetical protein